MFTCAGFSTTGNRHSIIKSRRNERFYLNWHVHIYFNLNYIFKANSSFFYENQRQTLINDIDLQTLIRVAQTTSFSEVRISLIHILMMYVNASGVSIRRVHTFFCITVYTKKPRFLSSNHQRISRYGWSNFLELQHISIMF